MAAGRAIGTVVVLAGLVAACHAHGDKAVTAADHGVTINLKRTAQNYSAVSLEIRNGSAAPVCLGPGSLSLARFSIKTDQGAQPPSGGGAAPASAATCDLLAAGASRMQSIDLGQGFSRLQTQTGRVCYHYAFTQAPADPSGWRADGMVCE